MIMVNVGFNGLRKQYAARKCTSCTHSGVNRTRKGYRKQCLGAFGAILAGFNGLRKQYAAYSTCFSIQPIVIRSIERTRSGFLRRFLRRHACIHLLWQTAQRPFSYSVLHLGHTFMSIRCLRVCDWFNLLLGLSVRVNNTFQACRILASPLDRS